MRVICSWSDPIGQEQIINNNAGHSGIDFKPVVKLLRAFATVLLAHVSAFDRFDEMSSSLVNSNSTESPIAGDIHRA